MGHFCTVAVAVLLWTSVRPSAKCACSQLVLLNPTLRAEQFPRSQEPFVAEPSAHLVCQPVCSRAFLTLEIVGLHSRFVASAPRCSGGDRRDGAPLHRAPFKRPCEGHTQR
eukprot:1576016-Pleurochrysis_carterae.AAC.1